MNDIFESMKSKIYKVMEDIWKTKDKLSSDYNNNLKSYLKDARKKQSESGKTIISFSNNNIKSLLQNVKLEFQASCKYSKSR